MDIKFWTAIYAAIISTIVFIWRLYEFYYDRRGKFTVEIKNINRTPVINFKVGESVNYLVIKITNVGKNKRFIEEPRFESNSKQKKHFNLLKLDKKENYPIALEPGEIHEYSVEFEYLKNELSEFDITKIKALIQDTQKNTYKSNWFIL